MSSPSPPSSPSSSPTLPLPLTASLHLSSLPPDASLALSLANNAQTPTSSTTSPHQTTTTSSSTPTIPDKITIRFQAVGSAPQLTQKTFKVSSKNRFESVVAFLGRKLAKAGGGAGDGGKGESGGGGGVFCYVNSVFAPGLDEGVGGLWRCFKTDDQLIVAYSMTPAFG